MNWGAAVLLTSVLAGGSLAAGLDCLSCHDEKGASFKASAHGSLACTDCHASIKAFPHPEQQTRVNCAGCHAESASGVTASVHAKVGAQPCLNCHGDAHGILPSKNPKSMTYASNLPRTCGACHGDAKMAKQFGLSEVYSLYMDSIHGFALTKDGLLVAASCSSCHGSHLILSSKNLNSRTNYRNIPSTCGGCHGGSEQAYRAGIHGQLLAAGSAQAPVCTSCHTAHQIGSVHTASLQIKTTATCGGCHQEELATYRDTFHAQVSALGYAQVARCWDCHDHHNILPASDAKSTIAPANLQATCAKCHPGATASFVQYDPHADSHNGKKYPLLHLSAVFMNLLLAGFLGFCALHTALWFIRSRFGKGESHD